MALFPLFRSKPKAFLGIDVGTTSVKIVELSREQEQTRLRTYGELRTYGHLERPEDPIQTSSLSMLDSDVAQIIRLVMDEARVSTNVATVSIPVFSSFFTLLEMPVMPDKELQEAIPFQARQLVPIPITEVILDWEVVGRVSARAASGGAELGRDKVLVLVLAVPKEVVEKYMRIMRIAGVELAALEVETFSLARALLRGEKKPTAIIDFGGRITTITVADESTIRLSHGVDTSSGELSRVIASALGISMRRAEALKMQRGLEAHGAEGEIGRVLRPVLELLIGEIDKLTNIYLRKYGRKVERYVIAGGGASMPGLVPFLQERFGEQVSIADPFSIILHPPQLSPTLKELGPSFSVACGLAMRELVSS